MNEPYPFSGLLTHRDAVEHELPVDDTITRWWEYPAQRGARTIVLVHGYRGDHHGLELIADALPEFRVVIPDLPGFGSSEPWAHGVDSIDDYGRWLRAFLDATGTGDAVVLGHSFGSIVVANAMRGHRSDPVILINPISQRALTGPKRITATVASLWYSIGAKLPVRAGNAWLSNPLFVRIMSVLLAKTNDRALRRWIHEQHDRYFSRYSDRDTLISAFGVSTQSTVSDFAPEVDAPVLLVAAERDDITPVSAQYAVQQKFPTAKLEVIPDVGHLVHYEKPIEAAAAIRAFLAACP